jgi:hypothetical protein
MSFFTFYHSISLRERKLVFFVVCGAIALSMLPYLYGASMAGNDHVYLWMNPIGSADTNVYFSFLQQVMHGSVFLENLHTAEPQHGSIFHPLWLVLGWIAGLFRITPALAFHAARVVLGVVFLLYLHYFFSFFFSDARKRGVALVLAAFSAGVGVFFSLNVSSWNPISVMLLLPSDQWISESNTFLTLLHSPLFILSQLLLLIIFRSFLSPEPDRRRFSLLLGAMFLLVLIHPYDLFTIAAVCTAFVVVRMVRDRWFSPQDLRCSIQRLAGMALVSLPPLLSFWVSARIEPAIGGWVRQNVTTSPLPHCYILGYGFVLAFAVAGFFLLRRSRTPFHLFALTWVVTSFLLLYIPIQINRRMSNGLHLVLVIFAAYGCDALWRWLASRRWRGELRRHVAFSFIAFPIAFGLFFSTLTTVTKAIYWEQDKKTSIFYLRKTVAKGMDWLSTHAARSDVILAHSYNGNIIPARTGLHVYIGHGHQTVEWEEKRELVTKWFFRTNSDDAKKRRFLRDNHISYLFFTSLEDQLGDFQPDEKEYLVPAFQNADVIIYSVAATEPTEKDPISTSPPS